ncbi:unnamed protein product [marine sediment metagenome]|uniref:Glutaredoxin domain-containing protein n=1 Tax=marine sediment metagenome TaxID=412755 RepID=X1MWP0_9ZZZZ
MTIVVYTSKHCAPCKEIEERIKDRNFDAGGEEVEVVDIETDEGFERFAEEVLTHGDGAAPSAYREGKRCVIGFDEDERLVIDCPTTDDPPSAGQE